MGISRSATCVISFIMKEYGKDLSSALIHTKDRRSIVNPNKRWDHFKTLIWNFTSKINPAIIVSSSNWKSMRVSLEHLDTDNSITEDYFDRNLSVRFQKQVLRLPKSSKRKKNAEGPWMFLIKQGKRFTLVLKKKFVKTVCAV